MLIQVFINKVGNREFTAPLPLVVADSFDQQYLLYLYTFVYRYLILLQNFLT